MKLRISILLVFALLFTNSISFAQKKHEIRFASIAPKNTTPDKIINKLNDEIIERSNGRLKLRIFPGTQGDESEIITKMNPRLGRLHAAGLTGRGLGVILPLIRVLEIPFLFENYDEVDYVEDFENYDEVDYVIDKLYNRFEQEFEKKGYVLLGWAEVGFVYMFSKDKIETREDLKKAKMWTWTGDPLARELFRALNVSPIPLSLPDALSSLQTGLINAVYVHPYGAIALSWYERTKYMNTLPVTYATGAVLVTKKKFDELEPDLQNILRTSGKKWLDELVIQTREDNEEAMKFLREKGIEFVPKPDRDDLKVFTDVGVSVQNKLAGELYPQELLNKVLELLKEFRSKKTLRTMR